jgi:glycosyltransferase involved in cell wall biosynthesis
MNVVVTLEHRFDRTPDGKVWTQVAFPHSFWMRYLEVFNRVIVVARVLEVASASGDWKRADGEGVSFAALPHYIGPWQYLQKAPQVQRAARNAVAPNDAVILQVSSQIATCIQPMLSQTNHPYAVEVVADPYDVFAPGAVKHPLRPFFRWWFPRGLRHQCAGAGAAAYVTEGALQCRYPPASGAFSTHYSCGELPNSAFAAAPRCDDRRKQPFTLVSVGTLAQLYKAPEVLIDAVATCVQSGLNLKLVLVGDGKYRSELEARSQACGIADRVCFLGQLSAGDAVRAQLDRADIFILPNRQEGLPRAMIEAMTRALPCIGSTVGGIPELLPSEDLVPPGDITALTSKIREVATNPERMARMSARNLQKAIEYRDEALREQRNEFYRYVPEMTEAWLKQKN